MLDSVAKALMNPSHINPNKEPYTYLLGDKS